MSRRPGALLSPSAVWYYVNDMDMLLRLADEERVKRSNFKQLVGAQKKSSPGLPQRKSHWQLRKYVSGGSSASRSSGNRASCLGGSRHCPSHLLMVPCGWTSCARCIRTQTSMARGCKLWRIRAW